MAANGVILVANGFGNRRAADGNGTRAAILTRGTAVPEVIQLTRLIRRIASGGLCRVRITAAAPLPRRLPVTATAVSMVTFMHGRWPKFRRMAVNVTVRQKKQSNTAGPTGRALTKK